MIAISSSSCSSCRVSWADPPDVVDWWSAGEASSVGCTACCSCRWAALAGGTKAGTGSSTTAVSAARLAAWSVPDERRTHTCWVLPEQLDCRAGAAPDVAPTQKICRAETRLVGGCLLSSCRLQCRATCDDILYLGRDSGYIEADFHEKFFPPAMLDEPVRHAQRSNPGRDL